MAGLPPELWDIILTFLLEIDIKTVACSRPIFIYFNELVLNNKNLKIKLFLAENGKLSKSPIKQFRWACEYGHLEIVKYLVESSI